MLHVEIDVAPKTSKQEKDESDHHRHKESMRTSGNIGWTTWTMKREVTQSMSTPRWPKKMSKEWHCRREMSITINQWLTFHQAFIHKFITTRTIEQHQFIKYSNLRSNSGNQYEHTKIKSILFTVWPNDTTDAWNMEEQFFKNSEKNLKHFDNMRKALQKYFDDTVKIFLSTCGSNTIVYERFNPATTWRHHSWTPRV